MESKNIKITENIFLWEQEINLEERNPNIYIGIGLINSKGDITIDLPLDILIVIGAILELKKKMNLKITFILADKNAILQFSQSQTNKINEISIITEIYYKKLKKILKYFNLLEISKIIKVTTLNEDEKYKNIIIPENNNNLYENEQLKTMKYFNMMGYNYRLSWKGHKKKRTHKEMKNILILYMKNHLTKNQ